MAELLERNWTLDELAAKLGEDRLFVKDFLLEYVDLTPDLAKKIAAATGISETFWTNQQTRHFAARRLMEAAAAQ